MNSQNMDKQINHSNKNNVTKETASIQEADPLSSKICLHSRKLLGWLDESEGNKLKDSKHFLEKHVQNCLYCSSYLQNILMIRNKLEGHIPFKIPDRMVEQSIARELAELLSRVKIDKIPRSSSSRSHFLLRKLQSLLSTVIKY